MWVQGSVEPPARAPHSVIQSSVGIFQWSCVFSVINHLIKLIKRGGAECRGGEALDEGCEGD